MPFGITRTAATYRREIFRIKTGAEVAENGVIDGTLVPLNSDGRRIVEEGQVLVYAGLPEIQQVAPGGTGGTYTLTFGGQTTGAIGRLLSAAAFQAIFEAISSVGAGNVSVSGPDGGPYLVRFTGTLGAADQAAITATSSLTGAGAGVVITEVRKGVVPTANAGQKLRPAPASGASAAQVAGVLMTTVELWPETIPQDAGDKPVAVYTKNCHFAAAQLIGYSGNSAAVQTAMTGAGATGGRTANCTFES